MKNAATATAYLEEDFSSKKDSSSDLTRAQLKRDIATLLAGKSRAEVAQAVDCPKETVKEWLTGEGAPDSVNLMKLGIRFPEVRRYVRFRMGEDEETIESPRALAARLEAVERLLEQQTEEGAALRRVATGQSRAEARARRKALR